MNLEGTEYQNYLKIGSETRIAIGYPFVKECNVAPEAQLVPSADLTKQDCTGNFDVLLTNLMELIGSYD